MIYASRFKRLAALIYDSLLIGALLFCSTFLVLFFHEGEAFPQPFMTVYLFSVAGVYLGWCWVKGKTLGMRAWKLAIRSTNGKKLTLTQVMMRYVVATLGFWCFGIGLIWCFIDKNKQSLADRIAKTAWISEA